MVEPTYIELTIKILEKEGRPMSIREITNEVLKFKKINGKTPQKSLSSVLQSSDQVKRISPGVYALVNQQ
jgi:DNA-directed RNA polymerase delta subunit